MKEVTGAAGAERGVQGGVGDHRDAELVGFEAGEGQGDAIQGDASNQRLTGLNSQSSV